LVERVVVQTRTRVLEGGRVAAKEKVVSLFEPHTDVIVKDRRETRFGHKVTLTSTGSNLVVDCVIEEGNPADATLAVRSMERVKDILGKTPVAASFDGGIASQANMKQIKELGIVEVAFHKKCRLTVAEMVTSSRVYRRLRNFRAGVEGTISALKRGMGMGRCRWRGLESFKAYVWNCIVSFNLMQLAGMRLRSD
jgi:IS5 family transposase